MKSFEGGSAGLAGEQAHRQVEGAPPRVDRGLPPAVRRAELREHQRGPGRRGEVAGDLAGVVMGVLLVGVERGVPRHLLRRGVDRHLATGGAHRRQHLPRHLADRPVGGEGDALDPAGAVLHDRLVKMQIEGGDQRPAAIRGRQRGGLPAARGQPQRRMLKLRLGRGQLGRQLAEHLGMGVERVAGRSPVLVRAPRPDRGHDRRLLVPVAALNAGPRPAAGRVDLDLAGRPGAHATA